MARAQEGPPQGNRQGNINILWGPIFYMDWHPQKSQGRRRHFFENPDAFFPERSISSRTLVVVIFDNYVDL